MSADLLSGFMARCVSQSMGRTLPTQTLRIANGATCEVVAGAMVMSNALRDSGLWEKVTNTMYLPRADFARLGIVDRLICTLSGVSMKVVLIEPDPGDPTITVHLTLSHAP